VTLIKSKKQRRRISCWAEVICSVIKFILFTRDNSSILFLLHSLQSTRDWNGVHPENWIHLQQINDLVIIFRNRNTDWSSNIHDTLTTLSFSYSLTLHILGMPIQFNKHISCSRMNMGRRADIFTLEPVIVRVSNKTQRHITLRKKHKQLKTSVI